MILNLILFITSYYISNIIISNTSEFQFFIFPYIFCLVFVTPSLLFKQNNFNEILSIDKKTFFLFVLFYVVKMIMTKLNTNFVFDKSNTPLNSQIILKFVEILSIFIVKFINSYSNILTK